MAKAKLNDYEQRLLKDYRAGVKLREAEARAAPAPTALRETKTFPRRSEPAAPINPQRLSAADGPPPASFDPARPPEGETTTYLSVWRREPEKQTSAMRMGKEKQRQ